MRTFLPLTLCRSLTLFAFFTFCLISSSYAQFDFCATPTVLTTNSGCNTDYSVKNMTATAGVPGSCGNAASADVWFRYTPTTPYPVITINNFGSSFRTAGATIQILSGATCATLTSIACVTATDLTATSLVLTTGIMPGGTGLTTGTPYYIRISMATNTGTTSGSTTLWNFRICVTNPVTTAATIAYGKSYLNVTKGVNGGTIESGDILEMRATVLIKTDIAYNVKSTMPVPANTTFIPGTLRILTNEGQLYKQWTDAADGDPATITGSTITINAGGGATQTGGGMIRAADRPTLWGQCLVVLSYRVQVNAVAYGTPISVGGGTLSYSSPAGTLTTVTFPTVTALVYKNTGICTNAIGSNGIISETGGTFGSGNPKDRVASSKVPPAYTYVAFATGAPGDDQYGVSNNTSAGLANANYSFNPNETVAAKRVHSVWDIIGDHTGATNPLLGNPAPDVKTAGVTGGYMLVINAAFRTDTAYLDTVKNLCPNTSYEYSAWFRNICAKCSGDSTGKSPGTAGYVLTGPGDSSGVHPNLTFNINGYDYYTTGDILYTGQWIKKGFTYKTGPAETQMIINIRNNAPGGGGNDWAIDDIGVATCSPFLDVNPSDPNLNICYGNVGTLSAIVRSYFADYTYYVWERSTNNGVSFTNTAFSGNGTIVPTYNGSEYEYTAPGPSVVGDSFVHGNIYRLRVASSASNIIDPNCSFLATRTVQIYAANCAWLLKTDFLGASGSLQDNFSTVRWQTANEAHNVDFEIEKSTDGSHFTSIGKLKGNADANGNGRYIFNDPSVLKEPGYYRIKMLENGTFKYSKIILLSPDKIFFEVKNLVNPFTSSLSFDVITPGDGDIRITILDNFGRIVKTYKEKATKGLSQLKVQGLNTLTNGTYALRVEWQNESSVKRIIKLTN